MKYLVFACLSILMVACGQKSNQTFSVQKIIETNQEKYWNEQSISGSFPSTEKVNPVKVEILIDQPMQTIDGFGGCFNEMGWEVLQTLGKDEREKVFASLFDMETGCRFSIYRIPIGANDYSVDWYSHNETPGDFLMENFSIERDQQRLIPYIKKAMEYHPELKIFASPWCPPLWMKTNGHYACRSDKRVNDLPEEKQGEEMVDQFIMEDRYLDAYALYFSKFVSAYKNEGINIYSVHVQNEPNSCQNFPSCVWTPASLSRFIGEHLGPKLETDHPEIELWLGTIERPQPERVDEILQDEKAKKYIDGVGFQWAGKGVIGHIKEHYPTLQLMQTETECGDGSNDWAALEYTFNLMKHYFANGASSYMYWNMVLDHTGSSQWGWQQNSMITIDEKMQVVYNPEFYLMKHFSYFVKKGARYIKSDDDNSVIFLNPDNQLIIVTYNPSESDVAKEFSVNKKKVETVIKPKTLSTFVLQI